jgi:hypothetical protein
MERLLGLRREYEASMKTISKDSGNGRALRVYTTSDYDILILVEREPYEDGNRRRRWQEWRVSVSRSELAKIAQLFPVEAK